MLDALSCGGVTARAIERELLSLHCWNPRDFTQNKHRRVDDRPYGGGPGMVMQVQPLRDCLQAARAYRPESGKDVGSGRVVYLSPQGTTLDQSVVSRLLSYPRLIFLCGRYEGIDERVLQQDVDEELSIGDYVLSGGELAAMVTIDAIARQIPGALGHAESAVQDSFYDGLLDHPHYSRPEIYQGQAVPQVLLEGNHQAVETWRHKQALGRTWQRRPDLLAQRALSPQQDALLAEFIAELKLEDEQ